MLSFVIMPTTHETRTKVTCQCALYSCKAHPKKASHGPSNTRVPSLLVLNSKKADGYGAASGSRRPLCQALLVSVTDGAQWSLPGAKPGHGTHDINALHWLQTRRPQRNLERVEKETDPRGSAHADLLLRDTGGTSVLPQKTSVSLFPRVHCSQLTTSLLTVVPMQGAGHFKNKQCTPSRTPSPPKVVPAGQS